MATFDPATSAVFEASPVLFWGSLLALAFLAQPRFWAAAGSSQAVYAKGLSPVYKVTSPSRLPGFHLMVAGVFVLLVSVNVAGLLPWSFTFTGHPGLSGVWGLSLWAAVTLSGLIMSPLKSVSGLVPKGAPAFLTPLLLLSEVVSVLVRPVTLTIRLVTNLVAGHLILGLLAVQVLAHPISLPVLILFMGLEVAVALIQAFVFVLLLSIYASEHAC